MKLPHALLLAPALLAGCASEPPGRPVPIPDWRPSEDTAAKRESPVNWADGLSLLEALRAVERHGTAIAALEEWEAARGRRVQAGTYPLYPEVSVDGGVSFEGDSSRLGLSVKQMLELGGRVSRRESVADAGIARAEADAKDAVRGLRARVRRAWWTAYIAARKLDVTRRFAELSAKDVEVAVARYDARQASAIDVNLAKAREAKARAAVKMTEGEVATSRAEVEALVWEAAPEGWHLEIADVGGRPEPDLAKTLALALSGRPDLESLAMSSRESEAKSRLADAEGAPDLGLMLGYEWSRDRIMGDGVDIRMSDHMLTFGVSITLPLWNAKRGEALEAEADRRRFEALRAALATEVGREVAAAAAQLRSAGQALDLYEKEILPIASKNLDDVRAAYASGSVGISDLLRAQQDYLDSFRESIEAEAAYASARVDLESAVDRPLGELSR